MPGLFLKDFYSLKRQIKVIGIVLAIYAALSVMNRDISLMTFIIVFVNIGICFAVFSYDESSHFNRYAYILPVPLRKQVLARYLESLTVNVIMLLISVPFCILIDDSGMSIMEIVTALMTVFSVGILLIAIMFPFIYKMGIERARILLFGIVMIGTVGIMLMGKSGIFGSVADLDGNPLVQSIVMSLWYMAPLVSLIAAGISYFISAWIVAGKEA